MTPSRWQPRTEDEIQAGIDNGLLVESHYFDGKRQVGDNPNARKETARDLASFAMHGGLLLIGVEEHKDSEPRWTLAPQPLEGQAERIEQVATTAIDPPLYVVTTPIPGAAGGGTGYLLVEVPPSPRAPHMVEGTYYGRGDKTKIKLADAEVVAHHARRESEHAIADRLLDEEVARDPVRDPDLRTCGRLYVVAQPLTPRPVAALELVRSSDRELRDLLQTAEGHVRVQDRGAEPSPRLLQHLARRANGVALSSYEMGGPGRTLQANRTGSDPDQEAMLDVELRQDGGIRLLVGRLTADWGSKFDRDGQLVERDQVVVDVLAVSYAIRLAAWAAAIAESTGYRGQWVLGVHGTGLRGRASYLFRQNTGPGRSGGEPFDVDEYREITTATHLELTKRPRAVADRLVGRLVRGLGVEHMYEDALIADG